MVFRLAWNLQKSSCLGFLSPGIRGLSHHIGLLPATSPSLQLCPLSMETIPYLPCQLPPGDCGPLRPRLPSLCALPIHQPCRALEPRAPLLLSGARTCTRAPLALPRCPVWPRNPQFASEPAPGPLRCGKPAGSGAPVPTPASSPLPAALGVPDAQPRGAALCDP